MRKKAMKLISVMLAIFMAFAAVPLSGLAGIDLPIFRASAVEETETEISGKLGTKLTWSIDKASKTLTIDNKGQMISFSTTEAPWKNYKSYFDAVVINDGCANVGAGAFQHCDNIVSVDLPSSISTIDDSAFYGCGLKTIEIPYGVKTINSSSFSFCRNLETVKLAYGVTTIGSYAFEYCINLININIPDSVDVLGSAAFRNCIRLENIKISDSVGHLGSYTFADCVSLSNVLLGSRIKTIGNNAFAGCKNLSVISMPYFCGKISMSAFAGCSNLSQVYIYNKGCSIDQDAIPITATIYGFTGSTAEDFATQYGYNFVSIDTPCEHEYSNDCDNSCNKCGEIRDAAHSFGGWTVEREATCSQTGLQIRTCSVCGAVEREALPLIDHTDANDDGICDICKKQFALRYPKKGVCGPKLTWTLDDDGVLTIEGTGKMYDFYEGDSIFVSDDVQGPNETTSQHEGISTVRSYNELIGPTEARANHTHSIREESTTAVCKENVTEPYVENTTVAARKQTAKMQGYSIVPDETKSETIPYGYIRVSRWNMHFDEIKKVIIKEGVTEISNRAFKNCKQLSEVKIADSVKSIGKEAFFGCSFLKEISIPKNVESIGYRAFGSCELLSTFDYDAVNCPCGYYCDDTVDWFDKNTVIKTLYIGSDVKRIPKIRSIQTVIFKDDVTKIPDGAFSNSDELIAVSLPETLTRIGDEAFYNCKSIREITIPTGVAYIGRGAFDKCESLEVLNFNAYNCAFYQQEDDRSRCFKGNNIKKLNVGNAVNTLPHITTLETVTFAEGAVEVPNDSFEFCSNLVTVNLPSTISKIGDRAFEECLSLESITIPDGVNYIGNGAFWDCTVLTDLSLPMALTEIGEYAFMNCSSLKKIVLPKAVEKISDNAFSGCNSLKELDLSLIKEIGDFAFAGCSGLQELDLASVNEIGCSAFARCSSLTELEIPQGVKRINSQAFMDCKSIETVNYNAEDCEISNYYIFANCTAVKTVNIGSTVRSIPAYTFSGCSNLERAYFPDIAVQIDPLAFFGCGNVAIVCPNGSYANVYAIQNGIKYILEDGVNDTAFEIRNGMLLGYSGSAQNIVLPSDLNSVGIGAFDGNSVVRSIEIPYNISKIYSNAFANCPNLEQVIIPFTATDISSSAFNGTNAVIYCYYNSYAYKFAMANNIKCELITVTLSENSVSTFAGGAAAVKAVPSVTVASGIPLVWRSADPTVADVDSKGNIVGKSEGNTTVGVYSLGGNLLAECKVSVSKRINLKFATPSTATVKYGEKLILHIDTSTLPEGTTVEWSVSGSNAFRLSDENAVCTLHRSCVTCAVESIAKGSATITAKVVDKNGNAVKDANGNEITASQKLTSKAGFFQKLVAFFKKLFGSNMVIPYALNKLIK